MTKGWQSFHDRFWDKEQENHKHIWKNEISELKIYYL